jgi:SAM-dependent methyltransferase
MAVVEPTLRWPAGFARIPDETWTRAPVEAFARDYDALQHHSWYANLEPTVREVASWMEGGVLVADYSGGTGILEERLLAARPEADAGLLNVDASAKFLRLAVEKFRNEPRCAFRLLAHLAGKGRLQSLQEAAAPLMGLLDGVVCANAIHLYPDPAQAMASWFAALRPGSRVHVQSGNIERPDAPAGSWIIDRTVEAIDRVARELAGREARYAPYRAALADPRRMAAYDALRRRYFPAVRPLSQYRALLEAQRFRVAAVGHRAVTVRLDEWTRFLSVYHEGILPWVGGTEKVDGRPPADGAVQDRLALLGQALRDAVGSPRFVAEWTYIDAVRP